MLRLKVLSFNIQEGGGDRLTAIGDLIEVQQPDAVALLEATNLTAVRHIAERLKMQMVFGEANHGYHVAWLSDLPIRRGRNHRLPGLAKTLLEIEVEWHGSTIPLFATHLASRWDGWSPVDEIPCLLGALETCRGRPHLLVGDFNSLAPGDPIGAPPPGATRRGDAEEGAPRRAIGLLLDAGYIDAYRQVHAHDSGYTYPSHAPWLRIDYHFASPELAAHLRDCDVVSGEPSVNASDHFPLWSLYS